MFRANRLICTAMLAGLFLALGCPPDQTSSTTCTERVDLKASGAYVGSLANGAAMLGFDFTRCKAGDRVRVFLTDGTAGGRAEFFEGAVTDGHFALTSTSGQAQIDGIVSNADVLGSVTFGDEAPISYLAVPALNGGGLYEVTINENGEWTGTGPGGATLEARQDAKLVNGVITDSEGQDHWYTLRDLSRIFSEPDVGGAPDTYLMIVLPHVDAQVGHGGAENLKAGVAANDNFVRLDLPSTSITPGTFVGRFQDLPDLIGFEFDEPDAGGNTHLRAFVCDGQPAPNGRAEWFSGDFAGEFPDASFTLDSISGQAQITNLQLKIPQPSQPTEKSAGTMLRIAFCDAPQVYCSSCTCCRDSCSASRGIAGTLELADGNTHAFYAVPAGEGAGIYEVKLEPERMSGTSIKGGTLDLAIDASGHVTGTLVAPDGTSFPYEGTDFAQAFSDPQKLASAPGTFLVIASPRGGLLAGSPGSAQVPASTDIIAILIGLLPR